MGVVQKLHVPAQRLARGLEQRRDRTQVFRGGPDRLLGHGAAAGGLVEHLVLRHAVGRVQPRHARLQPDRAIAHVLVAFRRFDRLFDGLAVRVSIHRHAPAARSAQKLVERQAGPLGLDVPQRHVHRRNGGHAHAAVSPVRAAIQVLPRVLDPVRIPPDQAGNHMIFETALHRQLAPVQGRIAQPRQSALGLDHERDEIPPRRRRDHAGGLDRVGARVHGFSERVVGDVGHRAQSFSGSSREGNRFTALIFV